MPISSTNSRLTYEVYKPPPKSLEQLRSENKYGTGNISRNASFRSLGRSNIITPTGSPIVREKHLHQLPGKKTAIVEPVKDSHNGRTNGNFVTNSDASKSILKNGTSSGKTANSGFGKSGSTFTSTGSGKGAEYCCMLHGLYCSRCCWLIFLLGLLLGALITGLITGLVLGSQLEEALLASNSVTTPAPLVGCFQSPCPSAEAGCSYSNNNTEINCTCLASNEEPVSSSEVFAQGYQCTLVNFTSTMTPATVAAP